MAEGRAKIEAALELGMTLVDTADIYGMDGGGAVGDSEALLGQVLEAAPELRRRMVLATKWRDRSRGPVRLEPNPRGGRVRCVPDAGSGPT